MQSSYVSSTKRDLPARFESLNDDTLVGLVLMLKDMFEKKILELKSKKLWQNKRQLLFQVLNLAMIVYSAPMIWKGMFVTKVNELCFKKDLILRGV